MSHKSFLIFLTLAVGVLIFFSVSCRKTDLTLKNNDSDKVLAYLESQKVPTKNSVNKNANIDLLKENLDFSETRTEPLDGRLNILIIPIKDAVIKRKNLDQNSTLTLFLFTNKQGEISSAGIVYFQPSDSKKHTALPQNTISNLCRGKAVQLDGVYKMLTITGRWLSQLQIKSGRLYSSGIVQKKDKESTNNQRINLFCVDWYLVTTYHGSDGSVTQDEQFLGTTCYDECDTGSYGTVCEPEGSGGGGSGGSDYIENGEDDISATTSEPAPDPNTGTSNAGDPLIPITWHAWVAWSYNFTQQRFDYITTGTPYPIPVSQGFTDSNGNPAVLAVALGPWFVRQIPLTIKSVLVQYTLISLHSYIYTTGTIPLSFDEGLSKVIGPI